MIECSACGGGEFRAQPRLASVLGPLRILLLPIAVACLVYGLLRGSWSWGVVGLLAASVFFIPRGNWYWGGLRCTRCGHFSRYR